MRGFVNKNNLVLSIKVATMQRTKYDSWSDCWLVWPRDTWHVCVMCHAAETGETMLGPALCLWKLQELKVKVWWWDQQIWLGISFSSGSTLPQQTCRPCHTALTATAGSEKLSTQTKHIPALYRCWESVPTQKSKIGPFPKSSFLLVFWAWLRGWSQWSPGQKYKPKWQFRKRPDFCIWFLRGIYLSCPK